MVTLRGEGCCGVGRASRDSAGFSAMEEGLSQITLVPLFPKEILAPASEDTDLESYLVMQCLAGTCFIDHDNVNGIYYNVI